MKKSLTHTVWECKYHIVCEMGDSDYKGWKAVIQKRRIHHLAIFHNHVLIQGLAHAPHHRSFQLSLDQHRVYQTTH